MPIDFISLDTEEIRTIDSESDNAEIMMGIETDDSIKEFIKPLKDRHKEGLQTKININEFVFESVDLLDYSLIK